MKKIILICLFSLTLNQNITLTLDLENLTKGQDSNSSFDYNGGIGMEFPISKKIILGASYDITPLKYLDSEVEFLTLYGKYNFLKTGYKTDRDGDGVVDFKIKLHPFVIAGISQGSSDESADVTGISCGMGIFFPIHKIDRVGLSVNYKANYYTSSDSEVSFDDKNSNLFLVLHFGNSTK